MLIKNECIVYIRYCRVYFVGSISSRFFLMSYMTWHTWGVFCLHVSCTAGSWGALSSQDHRTYCLWPFFYKLRCTFSAPRKFTIKPQSHSSASYRSWSPCWGRWKHWSEGYACWQVRRERSATLVSCTRWQIEGLRGGDHEEEQLKKYSYLRFRYLLVR